MTSLLARARSSKWTAARFGLTATALGLALATVGMPGPVPAQAATVGTVTFSTTSGNTSTPITNGDRDTVFDMNLPNGAACTGDSATDGYRWHTYIVPASVDPNTLVFGNNELVPSGVGADLRQPLFDSVGQSPVITKLTAIDTGAILSTPQYSFAVFGVDAQAVVPPGNYNIGYACTLGQANDRVWNAEISVAALGADSFSWEVVTSTPSTTTTEPTGTTTTEPTGSTTTSTTTTTTPPTGSTTTLPNSSTTSTSSTTLPSAVGGAGGGSTTGGSTTGFSGGSTGGTIPRTGNSSTAFIVWGVLLLIIGRIVVLIARKPKVVGADE